MTAIKTLPLPALYEADETAWLEAMAALAAEGRVTEIDFPNLSEYLSDMAKRDRREVYSRLVVLMLHLLKWEQQPEKRSGSWKSSMIEQRSELRRLLEGGTLRNHAEAVLADAYAEAVKRAVAETGLAPEDFPAGCPWPVDGLLSEDGGANA